MKTYSFLALCLLVILAACKQEPKGPEGINLTFIKNGEGAKLKADDYAFFNYTMSRNDTTIRATSADGQPSVVRVVSLEEIKKKATFEPVVNVLPYLSIGDSVHVQVPVDSIPQAGYSEGFLDIYLGITEVKDSVTLAAYFDELKAKAEAEATAVQGRYDEVDGAAQQALKDFYSGKLEVQEMGGVKIHFIDEGAGETPNNGDVVEAFYHGVLGKYKDPTSKVARGTVFDSAFKEGRGQALKFPVGMGRVIKGWDSAFMNMKKGAKAYIFIPSDLAYGASGAGEDIPADAELMFYVELKDIKSLN